MLLGWLLEVGRKQWLVQEKQKATTAMEDKGSGVGKAEWVPMKGWEIGELTVLHRRTLRTPLLLKGSETSGERGTILTEKFHVSVLWRPELRSQNYAP